MGYSLQGHKELNTTEQLSTFIYHPSIIYLSIYLPTYLPIYLSGFLWKTLTTTGGEKGFGERDQEERKREKIVSFTKATVEKACLLHLYS